MSKVLNEKSRINLIFEEYGKLWEDKTYIMPDIPPNKSDEEFHKQFIEELFIYLQVEEYNSLNSNDLSLLECAVDANHIEIVQKLLEYDNIDLNNYYTRPSIIQISIMDNKYEITNLLLDHDNIDLIWKGTWNKITLKHCIRNKNDILLNKIIYHPKFNSKRFLKGTCIDWISYDINYVKLFPALKILLNHPDFDINSQDNKKRTLMHIYAKNNLIALIKFLLSERDNIDLTLKDFKEDTPIDIARNLFFNDLVAMFEDYGIKN